LISSGQCSLCTVYGLLSTFGNFSWLTAPFFSRLPFPPTFGPVAVFLRIFFGYRLNVPQGSPSLFPWLPSSFINSFDKTFYDPIPSEARVSSFTFVSGFQIFSRLLLASLHVAFYILFLVFSLTAGQIRLSGHIVRFLPPRAPGFVFSAPLDRLVCDYLRVFLQSLVEYMGPDSSSFLSLNPTSVPKAGAA